jgi:hypothetical protein
MSKNTIKQHYVWREYLRSFCFKDDLTFSLINKTKIVPNNLTNVAQEKFFYKLHDINEEEYLFLNNFINYSIKDDNELKEYLQTVLSSYLATILKKNIKEESIKKTFEKEVQNDFFERHMTQNEKLGKKLIKVDNLLQLKDCFNSKNRFKTVLFLSIQLVRTKKQKKKLLEEFKNHKINFEKIWFFISFSIGNILAYNVIRIRKLKVSFLINKSGIEFITSDQPVVNRESQLDENGFAKYFKLYLPISPINAIILDFESKQDLFEEINISDEKEVKMLNQNIIDESDMFIFSKNKEYLEIIKSST